MLEKLNFSNDLYKKIALSKKKANYENGITSYQAFFYCIKDLEYECLNNLCLELKKYYNNDTSEEEYYKMLQDLNSTDDFKKAALECAFCVIENNKYLGTKIVNEKFNASSWISHSLYEGKLCSVLASSLGLNPDVAMKLGILHDIGRKKIHTFMHTIKGYELLIDYGYEDEAIASLTHSFIPDVRNFIFKGSRCANCDKSLDGLTIQGNMEEYIPLEYKDDVCLFLDNYEYSIYDLLLNISDLMAMSTGITSPYERVKDIYTRKTPDEKNQDLFLFRFICLMNYIMFSKTKKVEYLERLNYKYINHDKLFEKFVETSNEFFEFYNSLNLNNKKKYL